jgi:hypothetical protein
VKSVDPAVDDFAPFDSPTRARGANRVRYAGGPLPLDVEGAPVWHAARGQLTPAWNFFVAHSDRVHRYSVTVDDASLAVLDRQPLTFFQNPAPPRGMVFERESPQPNPTPGVRILTAPAVDRSREIRWPRRSAGPTARRRPGTTPSSVRM